MGLFTWIKGFLQPQEDTIRVNCHTMPLAKWRRNGGYQPCSHGGTPNPPPSDFDDYLDREIARRRGSNPPAPGSKPAVPAEMPSDELLDQWVQEARRVHTASGYHINASTTMARLAIAWARQQQAQSPQLPPPGADPVATTENLWDLWASVFWADNGAGQPDARRAIYNRGRADERTAILRALGVEP
jgi:hypothetical protein